MKIDIYMSEHCGSFHELRANLEQALSALRLQVEIAYHTIYYDDAVSKGILGSPSIWINGNDAFEGGSSPGIA